MAEATSNQQIDGSPYKWTWRTAAGIASAAVALTTLAYISNRADKTKDAAPTSASHVDDTLYQARLKNLNAQLTMLGTSHASSIKVGRILLGSVEITSYNNGQPITTTYNEPIILAETKNVPPDNSGAFLNGGVIGVPQVNEDGSRSIVPFDVNLTEHNGTKAVVHPNDPLVVYDDAGMYFTEVTNGADQAIACDMLGQGVVGTPMTTIVTGPNT